MAETEDAWRGLLGEGEEILWQGRPSGRVYLQAADLPAMLFGGFFAAFALFWMIGASHAGGIFWMFGLLHFSVGVSLALFPLVGHTLIRRRSFYTLTSQRAYIATDLPLVGRRLQSWKITPQSDLELTDYRDGLGTITFAARRRGRSSFSPLRKGIGFELIERANMVFALMLQIQEEAK